MTKIKRVIFVFLLVGSISDLYAQTFNPVNGTDYLVEFTEWTVNGVDMLPTMQSQIRSYTITFNLDNTVVSFGNILYKVMYTFFPDGTCETIAKALFIKQTILGTGEIERSGRDFTMFLSVRSEIKGQDVVMLTRAKGAIKQ
jgi:predicted polyphosphate/ATP-dependent NAD kinase